ncbi:hypothetical protein V2A60_000510 [Cordyceps javanica]|uniref:Uncharacterized protein n=1 Tax=Cordyceps javanica TaxID=43265 RepID=A0A545V568_9HYPO|nr:hypothetical protein IF1G_04095 [Cordyceps javanica]TQW08117.1 hypothetical protein IF2G_03993 [Cordyceps javanica]
MSNRPQSVPPTSSNTRLTRSRRAINASPSNSLIAVHHSTRSAPATVTTHGSAPSSAVSSSFPSAASPSSTTAASRLAAQADALAKMTLEINLRSVSKQADRLEREMQALVQGTKHDAAFRAQHEARLQDMWKEILAVKAHAAQDRDTKHLADEECRKETRRIMDEMRAEIASVRDVVGGLAATLAEMPSAEQMQAALSQSSEGDPGSQQQQQQQSSKPSIHARIQDALKSTRRWNRDRQSTRQTEAIFCARYLRQQSKRDARMAVFLQRAVQRHVQARFPGRTLRPRSLDELCEVVRWSDVKEVVEKVLLQDTTDVTAALRE